MAMVASTMAMYIGMVAVNDWLFARLEFARGIHWIDLPAGIRLLATLLFAEAGAIGLLLAGWLVYAFHIFPDDPAQALVGGVINAAAPFLVYCIARRAFGLNSSLTNLTPARLLALIFACSLVSPLLHHVWLALRGQDHLLQGFAVMFLGDLSGTLLIVYTVKIALALGLRGAG